jgi:hypothetical protein
MIRKRNTPRAVVPAPAVAGAAKTTVLGGDIAQSSASTAMQRTADIEFVSALCFFFLFFFWHGHRLTKNVCDVKCGTQVQLRLSSTMKSILHRGFPEVLR